MKIISTNGNSSDTRFYNDRGEDITEELQVVSFKIEAIDPITPLIVNLRCYVDYADIKINDENIIINKD